MVRGPRPLSLWLVAAALAAAGCAARPAQHALSTISPTARAVAGQIRLADSPPPLQAGAARVELTPPVGTPLAGYSRRAGQPSTGVLDPLYVRAVALADGEDLVLLLSADLLVIPPGMVEEVARRLDAMLPEAVAPAQVMLCATHTHSGPGAYLAGFLGRMTAGPYRPQVSERIVAACVEAGRQAARDRRPARMAAGRTACPGLVENRVRPSGPVDPDVAVVALEGTDGAPIALLLNFAAHPTLLSSKNRQFSGDFPGAACRQWEQRHPGGVALFLNGAAADLRPAHWHGLHNRELVEHVGTALAEAAEQALVGAPRQTQVDVAAWGGVFPIPPTRLGVGPVRLPHWVARSLAREEARIGLVALNDLLLVSAPADLGSEIGRWVKDWLASRGLQAIVVGYANDYIGYVVPASWKSSGVYEVQMAWHGLEMESVYEAIVVNLAEEFLDRRSSAEAGGLPIIVLRGDPYTIGFQHGSRYRPQVQASVANTLSFLERRLPAFPFRGRVVRAGLSGVYGRLAPFIPPAYREELRGLADGSGVPLAELERVHAVPEIASVWCASSAAYGPATRGGRLLHLRNLDWAIHADIQRFAAVLVVHPSGGHPFVSLGYFGFIGVISGINDQGISVGEIGAETVDRTLRGRPMPFLLRQVLEEAGELPAAVALVRGAPRTGGFNYVFADAPRRQAVALETTKSRCAVFWAGDAEAREVPYAVPIPAVIVRADPALDPGVRDVQLASQGDPAAPGLEPPAGSAYTIRYHQQAQLIQQSYGQLDPPAMIRIAQAIAPPSNVQSILFAFPEMWVANARGATPAAYGRYGRYDLTALFSREGEPASPQTTAGS